MNVQISTMTLCLIAVLSWSRYIGAQSDSAANAAAVSFDTLAGDLPEVVVSGKSPYVVVSDIFVPQGKTVIIEAGTILLFNNFTTLQVMGMLLARGNSKSPIVMTSINDKDYNPASTVDPAPFDWNGVVIHESGIGTQMVYCAIIYSVDGIHSMTKFIRLTPCVLMNNGRANFTLEGIKQDVEDGPYEYALATGDPGAQGLSAGLLEDPAAPRRNFFRYGGIGLAATGAIIGVLFTERFVRDKDRVEALSTKDARNLAQNSSRTWQEAWSTMSGTRNGMLAGWIVFAIGATGTVWSFTF
ncbi:MAG: hypothetical protein GF398_09595 [Chitinivibrionales bacterium]|nr:hypothetical protein [Chitinivibrionales bacterium]